MSIFRISNPENLRVKVLKAGSVTVNRLATESQSETKIITLPNEAQYFVDVTVTVAGRNYPVPHVEIDSGGLADQYFFGGTSETGVLVVLYDTYDATLIASASSYVFNYVVYQVLVA